jgi:hypothetical protein
LDRIEEQWAEARERAANEEIAAGLAPLEHSHWDWRNKLDSVQAGDYFDLNYFEYVANQATEWLAEIGESR